MVVVLFGIRSLLRCYQDLHVHGWFAIVLRGSDFGLAAITVRLGGEFGDLFSVGVDDGTYLDALNSHSNPPINNRNS